MEKKRLPFFLFCKLFQSTSAESDELTGAKATIQNVVIWREEFFLNHALVNR